MIFLKMQIIYIGLFAVILVAQLVVLRYLDFFGIRF